MKIKFFSFAILVLVLTGSGITVADNTDWTSQWIGLQTKEKEVNSWFCFRKTFSLSQTPRSAITKIAVDSKYWLWINGKLVVFEGGLKRGPTPNDTYYDEIDLSSYLTKGQNCIAVLLWYWGKDGFSHKSSGKAGFLFQADIDGTILSSDRSWKIKRYEAYGETQPPHPNYRLSESNIHFDAQKDLIGWYLPDFNDNDWQEPQEFGIPPVAPWNGLWIRPIPFWKDYGLQDYPGSPALPFVSTGQTVICELPHSTSITPYLKIDAPPGLTIGIQTDTYIVSKQYTLRSEYITRQGIQEFESLGYLTGQKVIYTIPKGVKVLELKYRETTYNTEFTGSFHCDDPFYNTLWLKSRNTMILNMRDCFQDCPDRERAQWWADTVNILGQVYYSCDTKSHALIRKAISNLVEWQKDDKVLFEPVPAGNWDKELPQRLLTSIGRYGFWTHYFYTGDSETMRQAYPHVRDYLSLWQIGPDGLVIYRTGDWDWTDWGENFDSVALTNGWYYLALESAAKMALLTNHPDDIKQYHEKMQSIKKNFNKIFWNGNEYRSPQYTGKTDDRANALALIAGISDPDQCPKIRQVLKQQFHASPYTEKYVLEAFFMMHNTQDGLDRMKNRYTPMVDSDITTLWEVWNRQEWGECSLNHGWSGGPLMLLSQYVAGIAPEKAGFDAYHVFPQMGHLKSIEADVPTVKGLIKVTLKSSEKEFSLSLHSPPQTTALVGIPKDVVKNINLIQANGQNIWQQGVETNSIEGLKFRGQDEYYYKFSAEPGEWHFKATTK